jgi:hypothetical protein
VIAVEAKQLTNMGGRKWKKLLRDVSDEAKRIAEEGARLKAIEDLLEERTRLLQAYGYEFHTDEPHFGQMTDAEFKSFSAPVIRAFYEKQNQPNKETTYGSAFENVDDHTAVAYLAKEIEHSPLNTFLKEVRDMVAATGEPSAEPERGIVITQRDKMADIIREECELLGVEFAGLDEATIEVIKNCMVSYHAKGGVEFQCEGCGDWDADVTKGGLCEICLEAKKNEEVADAGN